MSLRKAGQLVTSALVVAILSFSSPQSLAGEIRIVEFYNTTLNHYFITAENPEAAAIDAGSAGPGWLRTGASFRAYDATVPGANPVCRFYGNPALDANGHRRGPNSHFYTVDPQECDAVKLDSGWVYEGIVFYAVPPVNNQCPSTYTTVKRLYNNRYAQNDSNHRYTVADRDFNAMAAAGWSAEGAVFCSQPVPNATATIVFNPGVLVWTGEQIQHIVAMSDAQIVLDAPLPVAVGDVVTLFDRSFKVTGTSTASGRTTLEITSPSIDDVFTAFDIEGDLDFSQLGHATASAPLTKAGLVKADVNGIRFVPFADPITGGLGAKVEINEGSAHFRFEGEATLLFDLAQKPHYSFSYRSGQELKGSTALSGSVKLKGKVKAGGELADYKVTVPVGSLPLPVPYTFGFVKFEVPLDFILEAKIELAGEIEANFESSFVAVIAGSPDMSQGTGVPKGLGMILVDPTTETNLSAASLSLTATATIQSGAILNVAGKRVLGLRISPAIEHTITAAFGSTTCVTGESKLKMKVEAVGYLSSPKWEKTYLETESTIGESKKCVPGTPSIEITSASCTKTTLSDPGVLSYRFRAAADAGVVMNVGDYSQFIWKMSDGREWGGCQGQASQLTHCNCGPWTRVPGDQYSSCRREAGQPASATMQSENFYDDGGSSTLSYPVSVRAVINLGRGTQRGEVNSATMPLCQ